MNLLPPLQGLCLIHLHLLRTGTRPGTGPPQALHVQLTTQPVVVPMQAVFTMAAPGYGQHQTPLPPEGEGPDCGERLGSSCKGVIHWGGGSYLMTQFLVKIPVAKIEKRKSLQTLPKH